MRYDFITQSGEKQICFLAAGMNVHISKSSYKPLYYIEILYIDFEETGKEKKSIVS